jgi:hypothetical protein
MSKIHFQVGTADHVQISLPSKMTGDGDIFIGKAKIYISSLSCSQSIKIHKSQLSLFFAQVAKAYETLRGEFSFKSGYGTFILLGEMSRKGHAKITVKLSGYTSKHPDNTEWQAEAVFYCEPDALKRVLEAQGAT